MHHRLAVACVAAVVVLLDGCAAGTRPSSTPRPVQANGMVLVELAGGKFDDARLVEGVAVDAVTVAQRWGSLLHPVTVRVHPNHAALEQASHQKDVPWMRGWARFDEVELEAPSSWGGDRAPANVRELLRHEMTHVVMYQQVATRDGWASVAIPLWFREGMASVTSQQGYRRMTGSELGVWLARNPAMDPWMGSDALGATGQPVIYGAAHRAFERLLTRVSDDGIRRILTGLRAGDSFDASFRAAAGAAPTQFLAEFRLELEQAAASLPSSGYVAANSL